MPSYIRMEQHLKLDYPSTHKIQLYNYSETETPYIKANHNHLYIIISNYRRIISVIIFDDIRS